MLAPPRLMASSVFFGPAMAASPLNQPKSMSSWLAAADLTVLNRNLQLPPAGVAAAGRVFFRASQFVHTVPCSTPGIRPNDRASLTRADLISGAEGRHG